MKAILILILAAAVALLAACERPVEEQPVAEPPPAMDAPPAAPPTAAEVPPFEELDVANQGYITPEEAEAFPPLAANFEVYDRDRDGTIDRAEFSQFVAEVETGIVPGVPTGVPAAPPPPAGPEAPAQPGPGGY